MSDRYLYRPKFVDIRIRKPMRPSQARTEPRTCEHPGCTREATTRAPKSRDNPRDVWLFCEEHAALYNKNWNYFDGMSDEEFDAFQAAAAHGHRETWSFKAPPHAKAQRDWRSAATGPSWADTYSTFRGRRGGTGRASPEQPEGRVPAPVREALTMLELEEGATVTEVRRAYAELVRRFHPDANGGDRSAEGRLNAVVKAYKVLKTARRA